MKVLIIGAGGREHALAWKIKQSPKVKELYVAPGNAGTSKISVNLDLRSSEEIINWLRENSVDLVVVGPDDYLAGGIVDEVNNLGIKVFGPTKTASQIEWSKVFAKKFMQEENIPTAYYKVFTDAQAAQKYIRNQKLPLVIKASGLALGKGVIIAETHEEADKAIADAITKNIFGEAGKEIVIEEYLDGVEISVHAFCDGENVVMFPPSQDRKRIYKNDRGPNTGGMGTIAPLPNISKEQLEEIKTKIVIPTIQGLKKIDRTFIGVLFPGIMLTSNGPKVIEFNARFGDPETQSYIRILETDLVDIMLACIDGNLDKQEVVWSNKSACCIVLASGGYPGSYEKGKEVKGLNGDLSAEIEIFHAGTKTYNEKVFTNGGRVLGVTSVGANLKEALGDAYKTVNQISFEGMQYRKDIGHKYQIK